MTRIRVATHIIPLIHLIHSKISVHSIKASIEKLKNDFPDKASILENSIVNPIFGNLFESSGALSNLRFYGPELRFAKENNIRDFARDSSTNPLTKLLLALFPSPTGSLCYIRNMNTNFGSIFIKDKNRGIEFLSKVFSSILRSENSISSEFEEFTDIAKLFLQDYAGLDLDTKSIKLMIIHSFIMNALDSEDDLRSYLTDICIEINETDVELFKSNYNVIDSIMNVETSTKGFPYSKVNLPPSNSSIPVYRRKTDIFNYKRTFSDCTDVQLLNLCNCLFYDSENLCYSTGSLDPESDLAKFYQKNNQLFTITQYIRNQWSKVIQDLDDFKTGEPNEYRTGLIVYLKKERNELDTGIINTINVLIKICSINHEEFWKGFDGKDIGNRLEDLFESISKIAGLSTTISLGNVLLEPFNSKKRIDFEGSFELSFNTKLNDTFVVSVKHTPMHAALQLIKWPVIRFESFIDSNGIVVKDPLAITIFKRYMMICKEQEINSHNAGLYDQVYLCGNLESDDERRKRVLDLIFDAIAVHEIDDRIKTSDSEGMIRDDCKLAFYKDMINAILSTVNLQDEDTMHRYKRYLIYQTPNLTDEELVTYWYAALTKSNSRLHELYELSFPQLRLESMIIDIYRLPVNRIPCIFEAVSKISKLVGIELFWGDDYSNNFKDIMQGLKKLTKIRTLHISGSIFKADPALISSAFESMKNLTTLSLIRCNFGPTDLKHFSKIFGNMSELKELNIRGNLLNAKNVGLLIKGLESCPKLESLDLSENNLKTEETDESFLEGLKNLLNLSFLKLKIAEIGISVAKKLTDRPKGLKRLETLDIKDNELNVEGAKYLANALKELPNLRSLNISRTCINAKGLGHILKSLQNVTKLEITGNNIDSEGAKYFAENIDNIRCLTNLDISGNRLGIEGAMIISKAIRKMKFLKSFEIEYNDIRSEGAMFILDALKELPDFVKLNISFNNIGESDISEAIGKTKKLEELDISYNYMTSEMNENFIKIRQGMQKLKHVNDAYSTVPLQRFQ